MKTLVILFSGLFLLAVGFTSCQKDGDLLAESQATEATADFKTDDTNPWGIDPWSVKDQVSNYPDPFVDITTLKIKVTERARVSVVVYRQNSHQLTYLLNSMLNPGTHEEIFDATGMPSGLYVARVQIGNKVFSEKMLKIAEVEEDERLDF